MKLPFVDIPEAATVYGAIVIPTLIHVDLSPYSFVSAECYFGFTGGT